MTCEVQPGNVDIVERIDGIMAQEADSPLRIGREPGYAPFENGAQVCPLVQHPLAAGNGRLQAKNEVHGVVGVDIDFRGVRASSAVNSHFGVRVTDAACFRSNRLPSELTCSCSVSAASTPA